ncbi:MAG: hypothetical protein IJ779_09910 [Ruminococcus sp.]|nr:hypothetical protein [Ruminococcus sp.]
MEVKTNPFYELRNRLYASAAAGCALIAEDFRLKRAIEAFQPLSEANKVFGRLYAMCNALLTSENKAADIIDCIALADALAVTQGTFADGSETAPVPADDFIKPVRMTVNELESNREYIRKLQYTDQSYYVSAYDSMTDPRMIGSLFNIAGKNGSGVATFLSNLLAKYGDDIVPLLFQSLDLYNKNATGNQVRIISANFREKYNDRYIQLAEDETVTANIRIAAIEAMQYEPKNEERLLDLYKLSKGKIKNAALISLVRMNAPSAEAIVEKALTKSKPDYELACESDSKAAEDYVRKLHFDKLYEAYNTAGELPKFSANFDLLGNKKNIGDVFEKWGEYYSSRPLKYDISSRTPDYYYENETLIENLYKHGDKEYFDMIRSLYEKYPNVYAYSAFFAALIEAPENACKKICKNHLINDKSLFYVIDKLFRSPDGWYRIKKVPYMNEDNYENIKLFRKIPDDMIEFLTDTSVIYDFNELEKNFKSHEELWTAEENMRWRCVALSSILCICGDDESERIKAAAAEYAWAMAKKYPISQALTFLKEFGGRPLDEDIIYNYVKYSKITMKGHFSFSNTMERSDVPEDVLRKVCQRIMNDFSDNSDLISHVKIVLEKLDAKEQ